MQDSFFGLDVSTEIRGGGKTTRANVQGEYLLLVPANATFRVGRVRAAEAGSDHCDSASRAPQRLDLDLGNRAPRITSVAATDGTRFLTRAPMGQKLKMVSTNRELDGDTVEYSWKLADGQVGALTGSTADTEEWTLANSDGLQTLYLMARDGRGGFAFKRFDIQVGDDRIDVSGRAVDEVTGLPIRNATASLGGASVQTNDQGWFSLSTGPVPDDRYVLNITHPNFALVSRILDRSSYGMTYQMIRTQVTTHRGDQDIVVEDRRSAERLRHLATRPEAHRASPGARDVPAQEETIRRSKPARRASSSKSCARSSSAKRNATGAASSCASRRERSSTRTARPGLVWCAPRWRRSTRRAGRSPATTRRSTRAASGSRCRASARSMPTSPICPDAAFNCALARPPRCRRRSRLSSGPQPISRSRSGPTTRRPASGAKRAKPIFARPRTGRAMSGRTEHFSSINMDVAGSDPAFATCVRVEVDADFSAWSNLVLRAYVSFGGDFGPGQGDRARRRAVPRDLPHPVRYQLPAQHAAAGAARHVQRTEMVLLDNIINTDARPKMTGNNLWPPYPYTECGVPILLTLAPGVVPAYGDFDATGRPSFLIGPYGQFNPADGAQQAADYYAALDPAGNKDTLGEWWQQNGFGADGLGSGNATYVNQAYLNNNDLGFGRDMHCLDNAGDLRAT